MSNSSVLLTFSLAPRQRKKSTERYQVLIAISEKDAPTLLKTDLLPLYAIAMESAVLKKAALHFSLEAQDELATGPKDIACSHSGKELRIVVMDIGALMPKAWRENLPKVVTGHIDDFVHSFHVTFDL